MHFRPLLAAALCPLLSLASVAADSIQLNPSKDNSLIQVTSAATQQLSNGLGDIFVGRTNQDGQGPATISIRRGLIAFDIAGSLPTGAIVTSATLTMRDVQGLNGDRAVNLHRTLADWGEGTSFFQGGQGAPATDDDVTWYYRFYNSADPAASPAWATPGGDYAPTASATSIISDDNGPGQLFSWTSALDPQMLVDVQTWLADPASNFGWTMIGVESAGQTAKRLNSRESTTPPNTPPLLSLEYFVIPEPASLALFAIASSFALVRRQRREIRAA